MSVEQTAIRHAKLKAEIARLKQWVSDLQSGMYVNCVYCGHRYGPGETTPVSMADALKAHVERCPEHPMAKMRELLVRIKNHSQEGNPKDARYSHLKTVDDLADAFVAKCKEAEEQGAQIYKDICEVLK